MQIALFGDKVEARVIAKEGTVIDISVRKEIGKNWGRR